MAATVWKGYLSFGLVSIPVKAYRAARAERVNLHQLYRASLPAERVQAAGRGPIPIRGSAAEMPLAPDAAPAMEVEGEQDAPVSRVQQRAWTPGEEGPIESEKLLRGYEYAKDQYVVVEREELKKLAIPTSRELQILESVLLSEIDPIYFETSYYLAPDRGGEKPYSMLFEAMRQSGHAALGRLAMHGREHVVIVRPGPSGLLMHTMFYQDELRKEQEFRAEPALVNSKEMDLARAFLDSLASPFEPQKYKDAYRARLQELIDAKIEGREVTHAASAPAAATPIDLVEALKQSLAMRKPPATVETKPAKPRKRASK
jgi:DNA end-binding protein Ku